MDDRKWPVFSSVSIFFFFYQKYEKLWSFSVFIFYFKISDKELFYISLFFWYSLVEFLKILNIYQ